MISQIPNQFPLAQPAFGGLSENLINEGIICQNTAFLGRSSQETVALVFSKSSMAIGIIQGEQIGYVCHIPLVEELKFQKIFAKKMTSKFQIVGLKFIHLAYSIQFYFASSKCLNTCVTHLERSLNQVGFHQSFKPIRKIGKGAFATVYQVRRISDNSLFAVKAFSKAQINSSQENKMTILNEINLLKQIHHENILYLHEVYESSNSIYLVMEMYESFNFMDLIRERNGSFTMDETKSFMKDLFKGIQCLEEARIMHRDIKPDNILIKKQSVSGKLKLVIGDFGLASFTHIDKYLHERCGTPGYVAPQICNFKAGHRLTTKCDMFSLGVIMYIMLCKTALFQGTTFEEVYKKNKQMDFNLEHPKYNSINGEALDLMKKLLRENPNDRISAYQALNHNFFDSEMQGEKNPEETPVTESGDALLSPQYQMLMKPSNRKGQINHRIQFQ